MTASLLRFRSSTPVSRVDSIKKAVKKEKCVFGFVCAVRVCPVYGIRLTQTADSDEDPPPASPLSSPNTKKKEEEALIATMPKALKVAIGRYCNELCHLILDGR